MSRWPWSAWKQVAKWIVLTCIKSFGESVLAFFCVFLQRQENNSSTNYMKNSPPSQWLTEPVEEVQPLGSATGRGSTALQQCDWSEHRSALMADSTGQSCWALLGGKCSEQPLALWAGLAIQQPMPMCMMSEVLDFSWRLRSRLCWGLNPAQVGQAPPIEESRGRVYFLFFKQTNFLSSLPKTSLVKRSMTRLIDRNRKQKTNFITMEHQL